MVLKRLAASVLTFALAGCITGRQAIRAAHTTRVTAAFLLDHEDSQAVDPVPAAVTAKVTSTLYARNLVVATVAENVFATLALKRLTNARLQQIAAGAPGAEAVLLVETKAIFYSALDTKYRWTVFVKATLAHTRDLGAAISSEASYPVFLDFDHERDPEALVAAVPLLDEQIGRLCDDFVSDSTSAPPVTQAKPPEPQKPNVDSIYFVLVDRFANGDRANDDAIDPADPEAFHGGDLQGVIDHLDELHDLGVGTVWLSPVFKLRTEKLNGHGAFHGYWTEDLTRVEPRFGTEALLSRLSAEVHRRGMKLVLDLVLNHVGYDAPLTKQHPEWFHHNGDIKDWNDPAQLQDHDVSGLPDLAQEREDVYQFLLAASLKWIDAVHPDGFRLDAVKHVPSSFWARYNDDLRKHAGPDFLLLGEDLDGNTARVAATIKDGHFTSLFDFPLHFAMIDVFCHDQSPEKLAAQLFEDRDFEHPERLATLLDNHDLPRVMSACGGNRDKVSQALTFLLATRGIPTLTYGTENGLEGMGEPKNRGDMMFAADAPFRRLIRSLLQARQELGELVQAPCLFKVAPATFVCVKDDPSRALLIVVNHGPAVAMADYDAGLADGVTVTAHDVVSGETVLSSTAHGVVRFPVAPGTTRVVLLTPSRPATFVKAGQALKLQEQARLTPLKISVEGTSLAPGEKLFLAGTGKELGHWDPVKAVGPFQADGRYLSASLRLPEQGVFEFKLVIKEKNDRFRWEEHGNHYLQAVGTNHLVAWNVPDSVHPVVQ